MKAEYKELVREATAQGWRFEQAKSHAKLFSPDGSFIATIAHTDSDHRGFANTVARMRRAGLKWKGR